MNHLHNNSRVHIGKLEISIFENLSNILIKTLPNAQMTQELSAFAKVTGVTSYKL